MGNIEIFQSIAEQYDTDERVKNARLIAMAIRNHIYQEIAEDPAEKTAIDYGCGSGLVGMELLDVFRSVLFIDASSNMIGQVEQKIRKAGIKNAEWLCGDFLGAYPRGLRADYIILSQVLLHIKEVEAVLSEIYQILKTGGHLLIVDFDKNNQVISEQVHNGFEQESLKSTVKKIGFTSAGAKTFYYGTKIFMKQDASLFLLDAVK